MKNRSSWMLVLGFVLLSACVGGAVELLGGDPATRVASRKAASAASAELASTSEPALDGERPRASDIADAYREALDVVTEGYGGEIDYQRANGGAIQGMLQTLDPHSSFFPADDFKKLREDQSSRFVGIGVTILRHRDGVYVQSAVEGTPASRANLRYGDRIVEVDGKDAREWSTAEVSKNVRGALGTTVTLKVERAGSQMPTYVSVARGSVPLPSIRLAYMIRPGVGYVGATGTPGFTSTIDEELRSAIRELQKQGMRSLILDLRNNPGGLLNKAVAVASQFVPRGAVVVSVRGRDESEAQVYRNTSTTPDQFPLVVLINRNSASASEIVAGAVQDHGRGLVVGEASFGKGLVQRVFPLPFGNGLTLTTAKYYTPYGRLIQRDYSHVSFYEYYTRGITDPVAAPAAAPTPLPATPAQPTNPVRPNGIETAPAPAPEPTPVGPPVQTAGGRVFYGGGGITPDVRIAPLDPVARDRVRIFGAAFYFVRDLTAGIVLGFENYKLGDARDAVRDLPVTDRLVARFRDYVRENQEDRLNVAQVDADLDYTRLRIAEEIATAVSGTDAATRVLLDQDPQLLRAIEALPEAKQLVERIRTGAEGS